jgi:predicted P-loop ATPase
MVPESSDDALRIQTDMKGVIPSVYNYFAAIMIFDEWKGVLTFNEFTQTTMITKPVPTSREPKTTFKPRELKDTDFTHARRWFAKELRIFRGAKNDIADAMFAAARENSHDPVRFYLEDLKWDGVKRLDSVLVNYAGANNTDFNRKVGKLWMMSAVARIFEPGCKADCAIILESRQGAGKSTFLETLAGKEWFHDGLPDLHSKDAAAGLRGKWIIELPELSAMRRSDVEAVKAFLSRTTERFRPAYGRTEVIEPRRCVFAGTTNRSDYLADDTGGRRFWPVAVREIDISSLRRDRDQLWAEAVHCFNKPKAKWWLDASDEVEAAKLIMQRAADDPWEAAVLKYVETLPEVSTRDILDDLDIERTQQNKSNAMRVAGIITRANWTRDGKFTAGQNRGLARYINPNRLNLKHGEPSS